MAHNSSSKNFLSTQNSFKIKQEPTISIQKKNNLQKRVTRAQNNKNYNDLRKNRESKPCSFCGNNYSSNPRQFCPAKNVTCKSCGKKGHFAKVCNFRKNVNNIDEESEDTAEEDYNFLTLNSESEISALNISLSEKLPQINSIHFDSRLQPTKSVKD